MKRKIVLLFYISLFLFDFIHADEWNTGLQLNAHTHLAEKRTSLLLDNGEGIALKQDLTLSFDMLVRKENSYFGFVFRIISDKNENIDLLFSLDKLYKPFPELIVGDNTYPISKGIKTDQWFPVEISLSRKKNCITIVYDGFSLEAPCSFEQTKALYISFGKCNQGKFASTDVAPVTIKDIKIMEGQTLTRHWELGKHRENSCYDLMSGKPAIAQHPSWKIDEHCKWEKIADLQVDNKVQLAFDTKQAVLYIVPDETKVILFDTRTFETKKIKVKGGYPAAGNFSQMLVDTLNNRLISFNIDKEKISFFSFEESAWSQKEKTSDESVFWHHSSLFSLENDTSVYTFGGYGGYKYNHVLAQLNPYTNTWQKHAIENIYPRYSAATAIVGNDIYIYGGRGSKTGRQELSTEYLYDLHKISIETGKTTLVGNFGMENVTSLPAENMVFNPKDSCFYVLTDYEGGHLMKLSLKDKKASFMGDALPEDMSSLHLYRNLCYVPSQSKIYAVYDKTPKNSVKSVAVYAMNYPPLMESDTIQPLPVKQTSNWVWGIFAAMMAVVGIAYLYKRKSGVVKHEADVIREPEVSADPGFSHAGKQSICLLGGFSVIDKSGENITGNFSPTLRNLLLVLILYSAGPKKGIISAKLDELLWGDKDENSARNNRNVSIRKLRIQLEAIGHISINTSNNYWTISFDQDVFCDYSELMRYLLSPQSMEEEVCFLRFLELSSLGALLPNIQADWLDSFKSDLSSVLIDLLLEFSKKGNYKRNSRLMIKIADAIFFNDPLNEEALQLKCIALFNSGKTGLAKNAYDTFSKEYKALLNTPFDKTFNELIGES